MRTSRRILLFLTGLAVLAGSGPAALAQLSKAGKQRLEARQTGKPAKGKPATRPAVKGAQAIYLWRAKPNAPWLIKEWVGRFPEIRKENVATYQEMLDRELDILKRIQMRHVDRLWDSKLPNAWKPSKIDSARKRKELRTQEAVVVAMDKRIHDMSNDPLYLPFPKFTLARN